MKRTVKGISYYYLEHTIRDKGKRVQKSEYLGRTIPKDIEKIKRQFLFELNREKWFDEFDKIKRRYAVDSKSKPKSAVEKELRQFSIKFTYDTQRIEGSTLSRRETAELLEHNTSPGGKPVEDIKEAEAHHKVFLEMLGLKRDLSQHLVQEWHRKIFQQTKPDVAGQIRRHGVGITGSKYVPPPPAELQPLLDEFFGWYAGAKSKINPVELAGLVHIRFVTIHPFNDGNGRTSRLMMNFVLHRHGYPMFDIEYKSRATYYAALERSQLNKDERPFMNWFFGRYRREFGTYLAE